MGFFERFRRPAQPQKETIFIETVNPLAVKLIPSQKRLSIVNPACNPEIYVHDGRYEAILTWEKGTKEVRLTRGGDSVVLIDFSAQRVGWKSVTEVDKYRKDLSTGGKIALGVNHARPVGVSYHKAEGYRKVA